MASLLLAHPHLAPRPVRAASLGRRGLAATVRCQTQPNDIDRHYMRRCLRSGLPLLRTHHAASESATTVQGSRSFAS